jgi:hypothetical protein
LTYHYCLLLKFAPRIKRRIHGRIAQKSILPAIITPSWKKRYNNWRRRYQIISGE